MYVHAPRRVRVHRPEWRVLQVQVADLHILAVHELDERASGDAAFAPIPMSRPPGVAVAVDRGPGIAKHANIAEVLAVDE